uniref:hypothetical protein n=1 Tax=Streptomyces anthocyanicus TaxID=68174 RepID=UPI002F9137B9
MRRLAASAGLSEQAQRDAVERVGRLLAQEYRRALTAVTEQASARDLPAVLSRTDAVPAGQGTESQAVPGGASDGQPRLRSFLDGPRSASVLNPAGPADVASSALSETFTHAEPPGTPAVAELQSGPSTSTSGPRGAQGTRKSSVDHSMDADDLQQKTLDAVIDTYSLTNVPRPLVESAYDAYTDLRPQPLVLDAAEARREHERRATHLRRIIHNTLQAADPGEIPAGAESLSPQTRARVYAEMSVLAAETAEDTGEPGTTGEHGDPARLTPSRLTELRGEVIRQAERLWEQGSGHTSTPPVDWKVPDAAWIQQHWSLLSPSQHRLPLRAQAWLLVARALSLHGISMPGGVKKKRKTGAPQTGIPVHSTTSSSADNATLPSTAQSPGDTPRTTTLDAATSEEVRTALRAMPHLTQSKRKQAERAVLEILDQHTPPQELPVKDIVTMVATFQQERDQGEGLDRSIRETSAALLQHPSVMFAVLQRGRLETSGYLLDNYLTALLWEGPALVAALSQAPSLLDWLWRGRLIPLDDAERAALASALLRPGTIERLDNDPELREDLTVIYNNSAYHLLGKVEGRIDILEAILKVNKGDYFSIPFSLIHQYPAFATALLDRGDDAVDAVWRLYANQTLLTALFDVVERFPDVASKQLFGEVLGAAEDWPVSALTREHPHTAVLLLASPAVRSRAVRHPTAFALLARSLELVDVLEENPGLASRLLADPVALEAAIATDGLVAALAADPYRYDNESDPDLAAALRGAEPLPALPVDSTRQEHRPDLTPDGRTRNVQLLHYLQNTSPAWAYQLRHMDGLRQTLLAKEGEKNWGPMLRMAAHAPAAATPIGIRRALHHDFWKIFSPGSRHPDYTKGMWPLIELANRHRAAAATLSFAGGSIPFLGAANLYASMGSYPTLYHFPSAAQIFSSTARVVSQEQLDAVVKNSTLSSLFHRVEHFDKQILPHLQAGYASAFSAGNSALARLLFRHHELTRLDLAPFFPVVEKEPDLLQSLAPVYGRIPAGYWERLVSEPGLYLRMGQRRSRPLVRAFVAFPDLFMTALARDGFAAAWDRDEERFDTLAREALAAVPKDAGRSAPSSAAYEKLATALAAIGVPRVTDSGQALAPGFAAMRQTVVSALRTRRPAGKLRGELAETGTSTDAVDGFFSRYEAVLSDDQLRTAAVQDPYLAEALLLGENVVGLFQARPTLLGRVQRQPDVLRWIRTVPGLPDLLTTDDLNFQQFEEGNQYRYFEPWLVEKAPSNPEFTAVYMSHNWRIVSLPNPAEIRAFLAQSRALSHALYELERNDAVHALGLIGESLMGTFSEVARDYAAERSEDVFRAVTGSLGRLTASAEAPHLVLALADHPEIAKYLGDHPGVLSQHGQWAAVLGDPVLLGELEARPGAWEAALSDDVVSLLLGAPGLVEVLEGWPARFRREWVTGWRGELLADRADLVARLVGDEDFRVVFPWLSQEVWEKPSAVEGLLETPGLVRTVRHNRALVTVLAENGMMWQVTVRHPELASVMGGTARSQLGRRTVLLRRLLEVEAVAGDAAGPLAAALRAGGVAALLNEEAEPLAAFAGRFLREPRWQERAAADRDFSQDVRLLAGRDAGRLAELTDPGAGSEGLLDAVGPVAAAAGSAQAAVVAAAPASVPAPADSTAVAEPVAAAVGAAFGPDAASSGAPLSEALVGLLAGEGGGRVAGAMAKNPMLLPLLDASEALVEQIAADPSRVADYRPADYLAGVLATENPERLADDPEGFSRLLNASGKHFSDYLKAIDVTPAAGHHRPVENGFMTAWGEAIGRLRDAVVQIHAERAARFVAFRSTDDQTWVFSGRVHLVAGATNVDFTDAQRRVLGSLASGATRPRERSRRINAPLHAHLDGGSGGVSFFYTLTGDGQVDTVVHAYSPRRNNNDYTWTASGQYTSGPLGLDSVANAPLLTRSRELAPNTAGAAADHRTAADRIHGSAPAPEAAKAKTTAEVLAAAVNAYHQHRDAFLARPDASDVAVDLLRAAGRLHALGVPVLSHAWENATDKIRSIVLGHARTSPPATRATDPDVYHGALTLAAHTSRPDDALHTLTTAWNSTPATTTATSTVREGGSGGRGRGEPPVGLGGLVGGDAAAAGVGVDWYVPLPDEGGVSLAAGLVHVPREVEQPVAARLELTRLLARVVLHDPGVAARVVDSGVRVYVVGRGTPIGDVMRGAGVEEARLTLDGRLAHTLRAYTDPGSRTVFVAEENLLGVDTRTAVRVHSDGYSSTVHELAHLLYTYGLTDDDRALVRGTYQQRLEEGADAVWADGPRRSLDGEPADNYSSLDPEEYFAQATNAYFHANTGHDPLTGRPRNNGTRWIQDNEPGLLPLLTRVYGTPTPHHPYNPTTRTAAENSIWQGFADFTALTQQTTPDPAGRPRPDAPPEGSPAADPPPPYPRDDRPTGAVPEEPPAADPPPPYPRDDSASEAAEDDALPDIAPPSYPEAVAAGTPPPTANTAPAAPLAAKREPWRPKPGMTLPIGVVRYPQHFDDMTQLTALTEQALYEAGTNRARGPRHHRAVQDAIAHAATTIRTHIDARSPKITLTNADLLLTLPNDPYLGVWMTVVQGLANTLQHRIKVILPTTTQKDPETRLEVCPQ